MTTTPATAVPQISLPGQCGVQEGPVDLIIMYAMHHAFRRDLAAFARAALAARTAAARDRLGRHLEHEETEALALVQRHMSQADWHRMEQEHFGGRMPVATMAFLIPWVCDEVPAHIRRRAFAEAGRAFLVAYALTRPRYERQSRRAFAHAG